MISDFFFLSVSYAGGPLVAALVTLFLVLSFWLHKHKKQISPLLVSVLGSAVSVWLLKIIFAVERPLSAFYNESSYSFPSGHAAMAMSLYGFIFLTIWQHEPHPLKNKSLILLFLLILLIGFSRLYLGVHYFSDVLVGYIVGAIWLFIASATSRAF